MQLTLEVPNSLVKKIRALHLLLPEGSGDSFESIIVDLLDAAAKDAIAEIINHQDDYPQPQEAQPHQEKPKEDYGTVSGLGDEDDMEEEDEVVPEEGEGGQRLYDYQGLVPQKGGLTEEDLENDMRVDDPESEAVSGGSGSEDEYDSAAEDLFSTKMDIPVQKARDPRIQRRLDHQRKLARNRKGKVTTFTGSEQETL